jgi:hypothetical protein
MSMHEPVIPLSKKRKNKIKIKYPYYPFKINGCSKRSLG